MVKINMHSVEDLNGERLAEYDTWEVVSSPWVPSEREQLLSKILDATAIKETSE